jgi:hypothetical protein
MKLRGKIAVGTGVAQGTCGRHVAEGRANPTRAHSPRSFLEHARLLFLCLTSRGGRTRI